MEVGIVPQQISQFEKIFNRPAVWRGVIINLPPPKTSRPYRPVNNGPKRSGGMRSYQCCRIEKGQVADVDVRSDNDPVPDRKFRACRRGFNRRDRNLAYLKT